MAKTKKAAVTKGSMKPGAPAKPAAAKAGAGKEDAGGLKRKLGLRGAAPWAARHAAKHAAEARARAAEPPLPGSARATIRTPVDAEDIKQRVRDLHAALAQIKTLPEEPPQDVLRHRRRPEGHPDPPPLRGEALPVVRGVRRARDRPRQDDVAAAGPGREPLPERGRARARDGSALHGHPGDRLGGRARGRPRIPPPPTSTAALPLRPPGR